MWSAGALGPTVIWIAEPLKAIQQFYFTDAVKLPRRISDNLGCGIWITLGGLLLTPAAGFDDDRRSWKVSCALTSISSASGNPKSVHVAAADFKLDRFCRSSSSFLPRHELFRDLQSLANQIKSGLGVAIPRTDFFWKQCSMQTVAPNRTV